MEGMSDEQDQPQHTPEGQVPGAQPAPESQVPEAQVPGAQVPGAQPAPAWQQPEAAADPLPETQAVAPPAGDQREWVAVPPPHPYAAVPPKPAGKGLAVAAMALGLIAVLSTALSLFYEGLFVLIGGVFGLAALIVGIVALVKRSRPKAAGITGVIAGAVSFVLSLLLGLIAAVGLLFSILPGDGEGLPEQAPDGGSEWTPETSPEALLEWPRNMATGGIIFDASGNASTPQPVSSDPIAPGTAPAPNQVDRATSNDVLIYVDYSCPHCAMFEQTSGEFLTEIVMNGSATVEIVPLSFMDRFTPDTYYSSRAANAVVCLADAQPEATWAAHNALLTPVVQPNGGPGLTNDELLQLIDPAVGGVSGEARACIEQEQFVPFAKALNDWVFQNPVPNANDAESRLQGTPSIFVNGEYYAGGHEDPAEFIAFYQEHTN